MKNSAIKHSSRTIFIRFGLALLILVGLLVVKPAGMARAASTWTVTKTADTSDGTCDSDCSLREAVSAAAAGDTINFAVNGTIALASTITISKDLIIDGTGHTITVSGNFAVRIFLANSGVTLSLNQLTVANGSVTGIGGAISSAGTVNVINSTFYNNRASTNGGAIYSTGTLSVRNSTFLTNTATSGSGGAIYSSGSMTLANDTFNGGRAAAGSGGAIYNSGSMTLNNDTFYGGRAAAGSGGGIYNSPAGMVAVNNTIISSSLAGGNCAGTVSAISGVNNLASDATCGTSFTNSASIQLGIFGSNGGSTQTIPLLSGSSAINAGSSCESTDQRGISRPQGAACDIGAYEQQLSTVVTGSASGLGYNTATLNGTVNANFGSTTVFFQYGETASYGTAVSASTATGSGVTSLSVALSGLTSGITYHYRAVGVNAAGTTYGDDATFTTLYCESAVTVTSNSDSGAGSLRQAIVDVCPGGTITFGGDYTIPLSSELSINKNLLIDGLGHNVSVSGGGSNRVFYVYNVVATLENLTISNGKVSGGGAGIYLYYGTLTLGNDTLSGNIAADPTYSGGGIYNYYGTLNIVSSTFSGNKATNGGGSGSAGAGGGIYNDSGTVTINNSTFSDNIASDASGGGSGGGIYNNGTLTISNSIFSGNTATVSSGGSAGGGIRNLMSKTKATLRNTIIANSTNGDNCGGAFTDGGYNLDDGATCGFSTLNGSLSSIDSLLSVLGNYGGSTRTIALLPGSPAIDAGSGCTSTDQRGVSRPQGTACDIGAFESQGITLAVSGGNNQSAAINTVFADPLQVTVTAKNPVEPVNGGQITFSSPASGASAAFTTSPATISGGVASVAATANGTTGTYNVTASAVGAASNLVFNLTNLLASIDLAITKTDGVTTATSGGSVTYTLTASNAGPGSASAATVVDTLPASLTATWTCVGAGGGICTASGSGNINDSVDLPAGGSVTYTISAVIDAAATGSLSNTATVTAPVGLTDPTPGNNSATDSDTIIPLVNVTINQATGQPDPTNTNPINFTVVFSEAVTDFNDLSDVSLSGTASATVTSITETAPMDGTTYAVAVTAMTDGTVIASVPAGAATNGTNFSVASTNTDNTVTYNAAALGDFVWNDLNGNGLQDPGEPGLSGVIVQLTPPGTIDLGGGPGVLVNTTTDASGNYSFVGLAPGVTYIVSIPGAPTGMAVTLLNQGSNPSVDADNPAGVSVTPISGAINNSLDFGYRSLPTFSIDDVTAAEGDSGATTFTFTVSLSAPAIAGGVTFDIATADGTAAAPIDYIAKSLSSQTIPAGSSSYNFALTVKGDATAEADETFFVNITNVTCATVSDGQGQGTISNDDFIPTVTTGAATDITQTSATLNGTVNANRANTAVTIEYWQGSGPATTASAIPGLVTGSSATAVSYSLTSLTPNTTYSYHVIGVSVVGTTQGADISFTTNAQVPSVTTNLAGAITASGATLHGIVNPNNDSTVVTFEYGLTTAYGSTVTASPSPVTGASDISVSAAITGLTPNKTYHFRAIGVNTSSTTHGLDLSFTTSVLSVTMVTEIHNSAHIPLMVAIIGDSLHDMATVTGNGPAATGSVTFTAFDNPSCSGNGTPAGTVVLAVGAVADPSQSAVLTVNGLSFRARYNGDPKYQAVDGSCESIPANLYPTVLTLSANTIPQDGATLMDSPTNLLVQFNRDVLHDNPTDTHAADNPANYLLVAPGANGTFETTACGPVGVGGLKLDDTQITINSVSYDPATFIATLNINNGAVLTNGIYRLFICGTTSITDPAGTTFLNNHLSDSQVSFTVNVSQSAGQNQAGSGHSKQLPRTGFAPEVITILPVQPTDKIYTEEGIWLEIPALNLNQPIVGVPESPEWDVTWLGNNIGYLQGTAFPTWKGNSVLTGHVTDANGKPGPFADLGSLVWGSKLIIHAWGQQYIYEVRSVNLWTDPSSTTALTRHEELPWLTLITCRGYDEKTNSYRYRTIVRAVQVMVK